MGPLVTLLPRFACHKGSPPVAFTATKLFAASPVNTRLPAVLSTPARVPGPSHLWLQAIFPVR